MKRRFFIFAGLLAVATLGGCAPATFVETMEPTWASVEIRDDLNHDKAWEKVVDLLVRKFDLAVVAKDSGYVRTTWMYSWTGKLTDSYKVRATIKFTDGNKKIDIKSEAQHFNSVAKHWVLGTDTELLRTLKTDIMGAVSRTTR